MKHICILLYSLDSGGTERVTVDLINNFLNNGIKVSLVLLHRQGALLDVSPIPAKDIYEIGGGIKFFQIIKSIFKFRMLLKKLKPESVLAMGEIPNVIAPFAFRNSVITEHNIRTFYSSPETWNISFFSAMISRRAYEKARKIICVSQNVADSLCDVNKSLADKIKVIYNPLDIERIKKMSVENIGYETKNKVITCVGRLVEQKNHKLLLSSFEHVVKERQDVELWIVGDGGLRNSLENMAQNLYISDKVVFWGYQQNPYKFVARSTFCVSSSDFEGFSLTNFESLCLKKRIVTTNSISDFDSIITEDLGQIVPCGDECALAEAMICELRQERHIEKMPDFINNLNLNNVAKKYLYELEQ